MCFNLTVIEDNMVEENEVFFVSLMSEDSAVKISTETNRINITIVDDDCKLRCMETQY